ncbi:MAG: hypothetical protein JO271_10435 [Verrucomicrobia bacterium]|nr:hypothetical protein [Verrucomicrobiota bacterium]MBV9272492.1 hypothetical protein [Verrucomicrobiota bacterium]
MRLDYHLTQPGTGNWSSATEEDLRYRMALGDLIFQTGGHDFDAVWGWIPLIDLAASFATIVGKLERVAGAEIFEFTESDAWIRFEREGQAVTITTSYQPGAAKIPVSELKAKVREFQEKLKTELTSRYPEAKNNQHFRRLLG